jgi:DNA modification methylase
MALASSVVSCEQTNRVLNGDRAVHDWYRFVLSFPPHLVREYLGRFDVTPGQTVLDPFCGTGTTLVECKKLGIASVGIEANPMAHFAASVKTDWAVNASGLWTHAQGVFERVIRSLEQTDTPDFVYPLFARLVTRNVDELPPLRTLREEQASLLLSHSISALPLHKTLVLLEDLNQRGGRYLRHELLALAQAIVHSASNLHFGPEVGVGKQKADAAVVFPWWQNVEGMSSDLGALTRQKRTPARTLLGDARGVLAQFPSQSVDAVITSPPYPNEKDYTRTTRLESVLLGFIKTKDDLRRLKGTLICSNTRNVYKGDDDDVWVKDHKVIHEIAAQIEARRIELGKTSGFERLYARVTKLYFGGMARHLAALRPVLRPGAHLAYVVGDQASYLRVMIRTGQVLAEIAEQLGYRVVAIDLFRTRMATATREHLREEVVVLEWPGR